MEHTRYIKFDFHDNDFGLSAVDAIRTLFQNHLFDIVPEWKEDYVIEDGLDFNTRWEEFNDFVNKYYGGEVNLLAKRLSIVCIKPLPLGMGI